MPVHDHRDLSKFRVVIELIYPMLLDSEESMAISWSMRCIQL